MMKRREFLKTTAATSALATLGGASLSVSAHSGTNETQDVACCDRTHATVQDAMKAPAETIAYVPAIYAGTGIQKPDYLATIDVDPKSADYGKVISRLEMPNVGDELHHFGWNACSSCHGKEGAGRRFIVLPGIASGRIHIVDTEDPRQPKLHKVIEPEVVKAKTGLSAPHTVHCLADGTVLISMLGDSNGDAPGGFMMMDSEFNILGRWEKDSTGMNFNYDYWYQPRHNVMLSSEGGAPNTVSQAFKLADVKAGKYGRHLH